MANNFFKTPWAITGEKVAIPDDTQPSGDVSLEEGYPGDYSKDISTDPTSKFIERSKWNWLFAKVTGAIRELQVFGGIPEFITDTENGGAPFSYAEGARVVLGGVIYVSTSDSNTQTPPDSNWVIADKVTGVPPATLKNIDISGTAQIDASKLGTGDVSNTEFNYLDGVTSGIQTQLDAKQATGDYVTSLTGDVTANGPGASATTLSNTGANAGTYYNAQVQVDAKGRVLDIEDGPTPITLQEGFETFDSGLPDTLAWSSADTPNISQSGLHVTQGAFSCAFNTASAMAMEATGVDLSFMGEVVIDVYIGSVTGVVSLKVGTTTVSTPTDTTGAFTLSCPVTEGDTTIELSTSGACQCWWDNMRSLLVPSIPNEYIQLPMLNPNVIKKTTVNPTESNDSSEGYGAGSTWLNETLGTVWVCTDASVGSAVWLPVGDSAFEIVQTQEITTPVTEVSFSTGITANTIHIFKFESVGGDTDTRTLQATFKDSTVDQNLAYSRATINTVGGVGYAGNGNIGLATISSGASAGVCGNLLLSTSNGTNDYFGGTWFINAKGSATGNSGANIINGAFGSTTKNITLDEFVVAPTAGTLYSGKIHHLRLKV